MKNAILVGLLFGVASAFGCSGTSDVPGAITGNFAGTGNRPGVGGTAGIVGTAGAAAASGSAGSSSGGTSGGGGTPDGGGTAGDAPDSGTASGPIVKVTSPAALSDPNMGQVLTGDQATETCLVTASTDSGAAPVDTMSVALEMLDGTGAVVQKQSGVPTGKANEYSAVFALAGVQTGAVSFRCSAADLAASPNTGTATVSTFVDHGPAIKEGDPPRDSPHAQKDSLTFRFTVNAAPLTANDPGAAVDPSSVKLTVYGQDFVPVPTAGVPGQYTASVSFLDTSKYPVAPAGSVGITISAKNARTQATLSYSITVDGTGPTIDIQSPAANSVVGGQVPVKFTLTDPSGIDTKNLKVTWDLGGTSTFKDNDPRWPPPTGNTFIYYLDTTQVPNSTVQLTITIVAQDAVGNPIPGSSNSIQVYLDNVPPWVDLDPGKVTDEKPSSTSPPYTCSVPFDPLGPAAPNDLDVVPDFSFYRMIVWDDTNGGFGQKIPRYSGTDVKTVAFYFQPDPSIPLLIDTKRGKANDTGECDELALEGLKFPQLAALVDAGNAIFTDKAPAIINECVTSTIKDDPTKYPGPLCNGISDMTRVTHHNGPNNSEPVIWAVNPVGSTSSNSPTCTGDQWSISPLTTNDGWVCIAGRAKDNVGNIGVSPPLRVCLVSGSAYGRPLPACAVSSTTPPSCTDGCTPHARFSANNEVTIRLAF